MLQILRRPLHSQNEEKIVTVATPVVSLLVSSFCDRGSLLPHIRDSLFPSVQPPVTCPCFHPATPASPLSPPPAHAAPLRACLLRTLLLSESASCASPPAAISNAPATSAPAAELKQHRQARCRPTSTQRCVVNLVVGLRGSAPTDLDPPLGDCSRQARPRRQGGGL
jgi:hypothetical protein